MNIAVVAFVVGMASWIGYTAWSERGPWKMASSRRTVWLCRIVGMAIGTLVGMAWAYSTGLWTP